MHHHKLGGVTCGLYNVGAAVALASEGGISIASSAVRQSLSKLVHVAEKGHPCTEPVTIPVSTI